MKVQDRCSSPGEVLTEIFLKPLKLSVWDLHWKTGIELHRLEEIILNKEKINFCEMYLFAQIFKTRWEFWWDANNNLID